MDVTWDGLPVARENPTAVAIVTWRRAQDGAEFLLLHRIAPGGPEYEGDWAWTPPAGARQPGEGPEAAASRELEEETGVALPLTPLLEESASEAVALFVAEVPAGTDVVLDHEHDRFVWLPLDQALPKCLPSVVASGLSNAAAWVEHHMSAT
jgi:8-oxo-dGTP pyrophosphatase MutT (NUDIX family)